MAERDLYAELGLKKGASKDEIKKAYRKLARELHPDRNPDNPKAEERFKRVSYANDILADEKKRGLYDEFGEVGLRDGFDADAARAMRARARGVGGPGGAGFNFEEMFAGAQRGGNRRSGFGGTLEDLFGGGIDELFGRGGAPASGFGGRATTSAKAPDQESEVTVSFEEGFQGVERELTISEGTNSRTIRVRIPAGVEDGGKVRLRGQGAAAGTAMAGDIVLTVRVGEHKLFRRDGEDLHLEVPVTLGEAWNGASVKVPTPDGEVSLKLPARVQSGGKLRLKGKGMPKRGGGRGDLFAHVQVRLPDGHDHALIGKAIAELESHYAEDVRAALKH
ncbi:MAG TPA: DnaJ C-terminal domain-containing protein [Polyangiales bacterium]|nr:DnaJ C-terminal domain-containing protein [Polyangiales bacterium]